MSRRHEAPVAKVAPLKTENRRDEDLKVGDLILCWFCQGVPKPIRAIEPYRGPYKAQCIGIAHVEGLRGQIGRIGFSLWRGQYTPVVVPE